MYFQTAGIALCIAKSNQTPHKGLDTCRKTEVGDFQNHNTCIRKTRRNGKQIDRFCPQQKHTACRSKDRNTLKHQLRASSDHSRDCTEVHQPDDNGPQKQQYHQGHIEQCRPEHFFYTFQIWIYKAIDNCHTDNTRSNDLRQTAQKTLQGLPVAKSRQRNKPHIADTDQLLPERAILKKNRGRRFLRIISLDNDLRQCAHALFLLFRQFCGDSFLISSIICFCRNFVNRVIGQK